MAWVLLATRRGDGKAVGEGRGQGGSRAGAGSREGPVHLRILGFPVSPLRVTTSSSGREVDSLDVTSQEQLWNPSCGCPPPPHTAGVADAQELSSLTGEDETGGGPESGSQSPRPQESGPPPLWGARRRSGSRLSWPWRDPNTLLSWMHNSWPRGLGRGGRRGKFWTLATLGGFPAHLLGSSSAHRSPERCLGLSLSTLSQFQTISQKTGLPLRAAGLAFQAGCWVERGLWALGEPLP